MRTSSMLPWKYWPQIGSLPMVRGFVEVAMVPVLGVAATWVPLT